MLFCSSRRPIGKSAIRISTTAAAVLGSILHLSGQEKPASPAPDPAAAKAKIFKISEDEFDIGGIQFNSKTREIRIRTVVNLKEAPIEYMLVHETGKTHEAVLKTKANPYDLQVALLLCNYQPATEGLAHPEAPKDLVPLKPAAPKTPGANRIAATLEWKAGGELKKAPLSGWFQDINTRKPPPDIDAWIFNGSDVTADGFMAQAEGSFISVYLDKNAILNSPAKGNWDDQLWICRPDVIPAEGTEVTLILSPAPKK